MDRTDLSTPAGDYLTPAFETATVADAMRPGVFACPPDMPARAIARIMATHHIHSVVVSGSEMGRWGVVSDLDLVRAAGGVDDLLAADLADTDVPVTTPDTPLEEAARTMSARGATHVVVEDPDTHDPVGMLSTLDVAGNLAWARG